MSDGVVEVGCVVTFKNKGDHQAVVRFVGSTRFADGVWVGIEFDAPVGRNDGSVEGFRYFNCLPNHGSFVRPQDLNLFNPAASGHHTPRSYVVSSPLASTTPLPVSRAPSPPRRRPGSATGGGRHGTRMRPPSRERGTTPRGDVAVGAAQLQNRWRRQNDGRGGDRGTVLPALTIAPVPHQPASPMRPTSAGPTAPQLPAAPPPVAQAATASRLSPTRPGGEAMRDSTLPVPSSPHAPRRPSPLREGTTAVEAAQAAQEPRGGRAAWRDADASGDSRTTTTRLRHVSFSDQLPPPAIHAEPQQNRPGLSPQQAGDRTPERTPSPPRDASPARSPAPARRAVAELPAAPSAPAPAPPPAAAHDLEHEWPVVPPGPDFGDSSARVRKKKIVAPAPDTLRGGSQGRMDGANTATDNADLARRLGALELRSVRPGGFDPEELLLTPTHTDASHDSIRTVSSAQPLEAVILGSLRPAGRFDPTVFLRSPTYSTRGTDSHPDSHISLNSLHNPAPFDGMLSASIQEIGPDELCEVPPINASLAPSAAPSKADGEDVTVDDWPSPRSMDGAPPAHMLSPTPPLSPRASPPPPGRRSGTSSPVLSPEPPASLASLRSSKPEAPYPNIPALPQPTPIANTPSPSVSQPPVSKASLPSRAASNTPEPSVSDAQREVPVGSAQAPPSVLHGPAAAVPADASGGRALPRWASEEGEESSGMDDDAMPLPAPPTVTPRARAGGRGGVAPGVAERLGVRSREPDVARPLPAGRVVGLRNLGNSCFMNAVVQNVAQLQCVRHYAIAPPAEEGRFTQRFRALVGQMTSAREGSPAVDPSDLHSAICHRVPAFRSLRQQDAAELFRYLIGRLREEEDKEKRARGGTHEETGPFEEMFEGKLRSTVTCDACHKHSISREPFTELPLSIPLSLLRDTASEAGRPNYPAPAKPPRPSDISTTFTRGRRPPSASAERPSVYSRGTLAVRGQGTGATTRAEQRPSWLPDVLVCDLCRQPFLDQERLEVHILTVHGAPEDTGKASAPDTGVDASKGDAASKGTARQRSPGVRTSDSDSDNEQWTRYSLPRQPSRTDSPTPSSLAPDEELDDETIASLEGVLQPVARDASTHAFAVPAPPVPPTPILRLDLASLLKVFFAPERIADVTCSNCSAEHGRPMCADVTKQYVIDSLPAVITIQIKRFRVSSRGQLHKVSAKVDYPYELDLSPFFKARVRGTVYSLSGVVVHGGSLSGGHYVAYVRATGGRNSHDPVSGWYYVSDTHVRASTFDEALSREAYMLFYEKVEIDL